MGLTEKRTAKELSTLKYPTVGQDQEKAIPEGGPVDKLLCSYVKEMRGIVDDLLDTEDDDDKTDESVENGPATRLLDPIALLPSWSNV